MKKNNLQRQRVKAMVCMMLMLVILSACTDEIETDKPGNGAGTTATLELSLSVPPMLETKAVVCEADSGSEARKAGFYYEMQVLTTDTTHTDSLAVATKAASSLKNVYAFLFKSNGDFNGRASLATAGTGSNLLLVFSNIADASAANGRLVIIANDASASVNYTSSTAFSGFSGTYSAFQNLTLTSTVASDVDIPYVGSATVSLSGGSFTAIPAVQLYRMLAKIVLTNNTFSIVGGPTRRGIKLQNAGDNKFGTPNNYDGTGTIITTSWKYVPGNNLNSNIWYVGENIQTGGDHAFNIRLETGAVGGNTNPAVGQEYIVGYSFTYDVYLDKIALRRNNVYNITVSVSGTLERQKELASTNPNVNMTGSDETAGLNIGMFGGASSYTTGTGTAPTITGSYTKNLLIQPNTSGTTATDNVTKKWSNNTATQLQTETRKYWDRTYTLNYIDRTAGLAYDYCYQLTLGGVAKGTWYLPTQAQLMAMWGILRGIQGNSSYEDYSAFYASGYWSSSEYSAGYAWVVLFNSGYGSYDLKSSSSYVRCVRDL